MNSFELARFLGGVPPPGRILEPIAQLPLRAELTPGVLWREFCSAVSRQATGFSRIGVSLGGLDSSGILAAAVEERGAESVIALSYRGGDDDPYVDELCRHLGVRCVAVELDEPLTRVENGLVVGGEPFGSPSAAFDLHIASVARAHDVDVLLSGYAGDDILGGEWDLFSPMLREHPIDALSLMLSARLPRPYPRAARVWRWGVAPMIRRALPAPIRVDRARRHLARRMPWLSQGVLDIVDSGLREVVEATRPPVTPLEVYEYRAKLPDYRAWAHRRAQLVRESGLSYGAPYLDSEFVATMSSASIRAHFSGGTFRGLFREALRNKVPDRVRGRLGKAVLAAVDDTWPKVQARLRPLAALDALSEIRFVRSGVFNEAFERQRPYDWAIWRTLAAEAYLQRRVTPRA